MTAGKKRLETTDKRQVLHVLFNLRVSMTVVPKPSSPEQQKQRSFPQKRQRCTNIIASAQNTTVLYTIQAIYIQQNPLCIKRDWEGQGALN